MGVEQGVRVQIFGFLFGNVKKNGSNKYRMEIYWLDIDTFIEMHDAESAADFTQASDSKFYPNDTIVAPWKLKRDEFRSSKDGIIQR